MDVNNANYRKDVIEVTPLATKRDEPFQLGMVAFLLIDMQRVWLEPGLDPGHPEWTSDHYFYREVSSRVVPKQCGLLRSARRAGVEVIHTIIQSLTQNGRDRSLDHKLTPTHLPPDAPEAQPIALLAPVNDEILLKKTSSGVFNSTNIDYILRNLGVRHLVIAGIVTDQCVDMAVRDAADRGYLVTCVGDACAAPTPERHLQGLRAISGYCWMTDAATVIKRFDALRPKVDSPRIEQIDR
jgi:biuret amidohydrolase